MGATWDVYNRMGEAAAAQRWDDFAETLAADVHAWSPSYDIRGRDAYVAAIQSQNGSFEDIQVTQDVLIEAGDRIVTEWSWSIPHPAGEGRLGMTGMAYAEVTNGEVSRIRQYWDATAFMAAMADVTDG